MTREDVFKKELKELLSKYDVEISITTSTSGYSSNHYIEFYSPSKYGKDDTKFQEHINFECSYFDAYTS